jgi:hypothetical protein
MNEIPDSSPSDGAVHGVEVGLQTENTPEKPRPYRWGYFQGALLIPFSLLILLGTSADHLKPKHEPWYLATIGLLMGFIGLPLAVGLLWKRRFALILVYGMFGLTLLLVAVKLPIAITHYTDSGDNGSAFFEAELLLVWLLSLIYYRKRRRQFR